MCRRTLFTPPSAPLGGARFPCEAFLAGKTYGRAVPYRPGVRRRGGAVPEILAGDDVLPFAGIPPARVLAIPKPQQFAEKIHAYTRLWDDRVNMRTKDLVDLVLLIKTADVQPADVGAAMHVSLRPIAGIEAWPRDLGRPDVTCETMIRDHGEFVEQALHRWPPA